MSREELINTLKKMLRVIIGFAKWYNRRRHITKILIFMFLFIVPPLIYSYFMANRFTTKYITLYIGSSDQMYVGRLEHVSCGRLFYGKNIYYFRSLAVVNNQCYMYNETTLFYYTGPGIGVIMIYGNTSGRNVVSITLDAEMKIANITVTEVTLLVYTNENVTSTSFGTLLKSVLEKARLTECFCASALPSKTRYWHGRYVPENVYRIICS